MNRWSSSKCSRTPLPTASAAPSGPVYQDIPSLQHYVLVAQDRRRIELFSRADDGRHLRTIRPPATRVPLPAIGADLALDEIYEDSGA